MTNIYSNKGAASNVFLQNENWTIFGDMTKKHKFLSQVTHQKTEGAPLLGMRLYRRIYGIQLSAYCLLYFTCKGASNILCRYKKRNRPYIQICVQNIGHLKNVTLENFQNISYSNVKSFKLSSSWEIYYLSHIE